jgi:hypothetical protein
MMGQVLIDLYKSVQEGRVTWVRDNHNPYKRKSKVALLNFQEHLLVCHRRMMSSAKRKYSKLLADWVLWGLIVHLPYDEIH